MNFTDKININNEILNKIYIYDIEITKQFSNSDK